MAEKMIHHLARPLHRISLLGIGHRCAFVKHRHHSTKTSKPLRILFCGSDEFSGASLHALYNEQRENPDLIKSIDVLCRPGKRVGRSLKRIREVPIKAIAEELGFPVHERDTFKGWELPMPGNEAINLIIAVSFGLFVPSRILKAAEYGGLNVHPSLLPQFRGPAPIQHTIMNGHIRTGVTLQTLDDKSFDHGTILAQTPGDGVLIPQKSKCTFPILLDFVSDLGAKMLIQGLRDGVHVPPLLHKGRMLSKEEEGNLIHAAKITPKDRHMPFGLNAATTAVRLERALGRVWCNVWVDVETKKRLTFEGLTEEETPNFPRQAIQVNKYNNCRSSNKMAGSILPTERPMDYQPLFYVVLIRDDGKRHPVLFFEDGDDIIFVFPNTSLRVKYITLEGQRKMPAVKVLRSICQNKVWNLSSDSNFNTTHHLLEDYIRGLRSKPLNNGPQL